MLFHSEIFIFVFAPIVVIGSYLLARFSNRAVLTWLCTASFVFYAGWTPYYLPVLVLSIMLNFGFGVLICRLLPTNPRLARNVLVLAIVLNLAALFYYKYLHFIVVEIAGVLMVDYTAKAPVLPLGISFFTFTQIAILVDLWRREAFELTPLRYTLFVTYFPHLIAGPLLHHRDVMPQFGSGFLKRVSPNDVAAGLSIFVVGFFKKVAIADTLAPFVDTAFSTPLPAFAVAWFAALGYTLQLYFDFSGYSEMAIGVSLLLGVSLPINFASPYKAGSIIEFWRRWHMTLSRFLRDYLYIALGGNRRGGPRRYFNLLVTMILGGAWHGAGWTFLVWGGLHGVFLAVNHAWKQLGLGRYVPRAVGGALTFLCVVVAWVFFRAPDLPTALRLVNGMFGSRGFGLAGVEPLAMAFVASLLLLVWLAPNTQTIFGYDPNAWKTGGSAALSWAPTMRRVTWISALAVAGLLCLAKGAVSPFLYYQF